ncbi:TPA: hypothetical protein ACPSKB_003142 [Legionella feeleii]
MALIAKGLTRLIEEIELSVVPAKKAKKIHLQGTTESNTINLRLTCLNATSADRGNW